MIFPLTLSDIGLWFAVTAIILLITSELLHALPDFSSRITMDKSFLRAVAIGCGVAFLFTVVMRIMGLM